MDQQKQGTGVATPGTSYSPVASIPELFREAATCFAASPALIAEDITWTYAELLACAHDVAEDLRRRELGPDAVIGIVANRSASTIGGMLGILFAGAAYLPMDISTTPGPLLSRQLRAAGVRALLFDAPAVPLPVELDGLPTIALPETRLGASDQAASLRELDAAAPAYVMFTSGSTGTPKGVVVPHRAVARLVCGQRYVSFGPKQRFLLHSPLTFDASTFEIWGALLHGSSLVLAPNRTLALTDFAHLTAAYQVTTLWLTAATFHLLAHRSPDALATLQQLIVGGDVVAPSAVEAVQRACPWLRIVNGYGPTETTTFALTYAVPPNYPAQRELPIGSTLAHTSAYILDETLAPVPDGSEGQLVLGGDGVALGYVGDPELTVSRFLPDPYTTAPGARMYLTGDRVRRDAGGLIHFCGRMDQEAKIAGHRVDPHEIEAVLSAHPGVQHAAIFVRGDLPENKRLIAACELAQEDRSEADLRAYLAAQLPAYAVPASIALFERLPLSANGKLDRTAILGLLFPHTRELNKHSPSAPDELDALGSVLAIWESLLETSDIPPDQNFFDAGGDSLLLIQLHWRLNKLNRGEVDLMDLFSSTTPRKMASLLREPVATG